MSWRRVFWLILTIAVAGLAQSLGSSARFEAAVIRQASADSKAQPCLCEPPGRLAYRSAPMLWILERAFGLQESQMELPRWVGDRAFDVEAVLPTGATKEQIPTLLRALLEERFRLQVHTEQRDVSSFVLKVSSGGAKIAAPRDGWEIGFHNDRAGSHLRQRMTMKDFASYLSGQLGRPVLNETGLAGLFAIGLDFAPENLLARADAGIDLAPPLQTAVRDQLGLQLEAEKVAAEILVIDRMEQSPTEN